MNLHSSFPVAIIGDDFESKNAVGRGMRELAATIEKEGFRTVCGISYEDAKRLETDIHGLRYAPGEGERRRLVDCIGKEEIR
jgi:hypothetical protein